MRFRLRTFDEIVDLLRSVIRVRSGINFPFNDADVLTALVDAAALLDADQYVQAALLLRDTDVDTAEGLALERIGLERGSLTKTPATRGSLQGVFRTPTGTTASALITIPAGTAIFAPATSTASAIEYTTDAQVTILAGASSSGTATCTATEAGTRSNGVSLGAVLTIKSTIVGVADFSVSTAAAGGADLETDDEFRARLKQYPYTLARATASSIEAILARATSGGKAVKHVKLINNFVGGTADAYIDDGSGIPATIGPVTPTVGGGNSLTADLAVGATTATLGNTANFASIGAVKIDSEYIGYTGKTATTLTGLQRGRPNAGTPTTDAFHGSGTAVSIVAQMDRITLAQRQTYVRASKWPLATLHWVATDSGDPGVVLARTEGGAAANDYNILREEGLVAFNTTLLAGAVVDIAYTYYAGLVEECQKVVTGIPGNPNYPGWVASGSRARVLPVTGKTSANVTAQMTFHPGYDVTYGLDRAKTAITDYINALPIGEPALLERGYDLLMDTPGAKTADITVMSSSASGVGDVAPTNETYVVRANSIVVT